MRWINRLGTAMLVLIILTGPPVGAGVWLVHHRLRRPTLHQVQTSMREPPTAFMVVGGFVAVAAGCWLLLLCYLARKTIRTIQRSQRRRRLRLPGPAQLTASSLAGVAALTLPGVHAGTHPPSVAGTSPQQPAAPTPTREPSAPGATGIDLPGGNWLPPSTVLAVSAAASLIWLRRRQNYQPQPPSPPRPTRDDDLQPLPATVDAITAALSAEHTAARRTGTAPMMIDQLPAEVINLDGPGAAHAARGIIVSTALAAATGQPARPLHLYRDDLASLLPDADPRDLSAAGIHLDTPRPHQPTEQEPALPQPSPTSCGPAAQPCATIRLGADPTATVQWQVNPDGITTGTGLTSPQRLCILDHHAAADLINLVRHAFTHPAATNRPAPRNTPAHTVSATPPDSSAAPASLMLIGGCELTAAGKPVRLRRTAALQILAYLAIHPGGATKAELIRACWPHEPPATITQRLHTTISDLRNQLRPIIGADPIIRNGDHYQLNPEAIDTDLQSWRITAHTAATATSSNNRIRATRKLITLYHGELAAGRPWPWLTPDREALRRDAIDAYTATAADAEPSEAAALVQQALTVDPYNQELRHRVERYR